jgi:hypothetical protein
MLIFSNLWDAEPRRQGIDISRIDRFAHIREILDKFVVFFSSTLSNYAA